MTRGQDILDQEVKQWPFIKADGREWRNAE